ncbi:MAG: HypC/HybG/HupF family hydrogenase formation chaperone [Melioribacteraceae bacterium]|nr:HypC/HybG/HupF family hydrogenase formation chaperone [Melioribacteraceae bacterium]
MCLGIPGKVIDIIDEDGLLMGKIDFAGSVSKACLSYCENVEVGQYVVVHAGFAISVLDEADAEETLQYFKQMTEEAAKDGRDIYDNPLEREKDEIS